MTATPSATAADSTSPSLTVEMLRAALAGRIEPVRVTPGYRVALFIVALATVLLPVVYLGLLALAAWLVYSHAVHNVGILGRGSLVWPLAYVTPIVAGVVVIVFLFKPLVTRPPRRTSDLLIEEREHPLAFELIRGICCAVGAPMPAAVTVDCRVNASASLRRGLASLAGPDVRLCIGLPLVAGLTLRQLAGILAHEMGHFAQGSGMRLTYLMRAVNAWLARVVYERDEWDLRLEQWSPRIVGVRLVLWVARVGVWSSRTVLWALLMAADAIGMWMLRHMEYDADRYEARLVGSDVFATTALRTRVLQVAAGQAAAKLGVSYREKRLCGDFPALVAASATQLPSELVDKLARPDAAGDRARVFHTHPPDAARIASAERENAPGLLRLELPATAAFPHLAPLARRATEAFYRDEHDIDLTRVRLVPVAEILAWDAAAQGDEAARERVFGKLFSPGRPLRLGGAILAPPPLAEARKALAESHAVLERLDAEVKEATERMIVAHGRVLQAVGAMALFEAGLRVQPEQFGAAASSPLVADSTGRQAIEERDEAAAMLAPVRGALTERVTMALSLLASRELAVRRPEVADLPVEVAGLVRTLDALATQAQAIAELGIGHAAVAALFTIEPTDEEGTRRRDDVAFARVQALLRRINPVLEALDTTVYPFEHTQDTISLAAFIMADLRPYEDAASAHRQVGYVLSRIHGVHARALGRLASIVEEAEKAVIEQ